MTSPHLPVATCSIVTRTTTGRSIQGRDLTPCLPETTTEMRGGANPSRGAPARTHSLASACPTAPRNVSSSTLRRIDSHRCDDVPRSSAEAIVYTVEPSYSFAARVIAAWKCSRSHERIRGSSFVDAGAASERCSQSHANTTADASTSTTLSLAVFIACLCRQDCIEYADEYAYATLSGGEHETSAGVPTTMPAFPVTQARGLVLTASAERAAETASLIAVCRATSPNTPRNTRPRIPPSREGLMPHAACAMANAHACSGVHPLPLTTLSPRLTRAPTAAAPRWWMIAAMTAFTVFESPDVQAARSNVAMPALVFIVAIR
mmetsp:Transcript_7780/g.34308  ORF Transcript_7780/g.34308 Transcript_7780/m.34308 type:complete len:320 (+) Transcript_7780:636-1595(+)